MAQQQTELGGAKHSGATKNDGATKNSAERKINRATLAADKVLDDKVSKFAVTINKPVDVVFEFWREFGNLPLFMKDLKDVIETSKTESHWVVELKNGQTVEWDAEITSESPNEMITWKSKDGSEVETIGSVWFAKAPSNWGTVVSMLMQYKVPSGKYAEFTAEFTGEHGDTLLQTDLYRLKALLETGEIPTIEGQPSGRGEDLPSDYVRH